MSRRLTQTAPNMSRRQHSRPIFQIPESSKPSTGKHNQLFRLNSRENSLDRQKNLQPISHAAKRNAYDRIKKLQTLQKDKGCYLSYEQLMRNVRIILKEDIEIGTLSIFPGAPKNETGRAILSDGTFFVVFSKIIFRCQYCIKIAYIQKIKQKYLPNVSENKTILMLFLQDQEEKFVKEQEAKKKQWLQQQAEKLKQALKKEIQQQEKPKPAEVAEKIQYPQLAEPLKIEEYQNYKTFNDQATNTSYQKQALIRKPCIKPFSKQSLRKSVRWSQILEVEESPFLKQIIQANKQNISKSKKEEQDRAKKERIAQIKKSQSFLIDFFEINDIYELSMVDVIGVLDQVDDKYVVILVKQKCTTPPPSFIKTRSSKMQENEFKKQEKERRQVLAIGLLKKIDVRGHEINQLKHLQNKYPDIFAYVQIDSPDNLFLSSLPEETLSDSESLKKQKKK